MLAEAVAGLLANARLYVALSSWPTTMPGDGDER